MALAPVTLLLGGARSGKSRYGERLIERAVATGDTERGVYLATAEAGDAEMAARIATHQARRGAAWTTVEEPLALGAAVARHSAKDQAILVDCLTLWLSNLMSAEQDLDTAGAVLLDGLDGAAGPVVLVSNEVGLGLVPMHKLGRKFRDAAGLLHQQVADRADAVALMVAGIPLPLKGHGWFEGED